MQYEQSNLFQLKTFQIVEPLIISIYSAFSLARCPHVALLNVWIRTFPCTGLAVLEVTLVQ